MRKLRFKVAGPSGYRSQCTGFGNLQPDHSARAFQLPAGMALAAKHDKTKIIEYFSIHGDGELQEGFIWEAAMAAGNHKLNNIVAIVDSKRRTD